MRCLFTFLGSAPGHCLVGCQHLTKLTLLVFPLAFTIATSPSASGQEELPLPQWTDEELQAFRDQQSAVSMFETLLPEPPGYMEDLDKVMRGPLNSGPRLDELPSTLAGDITPRLRAEDMLSFLPDTLATSHEEIRSAMPVAPSLASGDEWKEASPEFMRAASEAGSEEFLIDPMSHLPEMASMELARLLEFHARDARIGLHVLVMGKDEMLPAKASLDQVASGRLLKTDSCLLVYPIGEPWRARLFVSQPVFALTSDAFLSQTAAECLKHAMQSAEAFDQLESYVITLSTRLFWLQRALGKGQRKDQAAPLKEFAVQTAQSPRSATSMAEQPIQSAKTGWLTGLSVLLTILGGGAWAGLHMRKSQRLRRQDTVWILPEPECRPRFGGAFTGGGGASVRYG
jgi:hypothetical protein